MIDFNEQTAIILISCPDKKGIVADVTEFLNNNYGNIIYLDQHTDREDNVFFMRIEWELNGFLIPKEKIGDYFETQIAVKYEMKWSLYFSDKTPRMALFVSKMSHCLFDILSRYEAGEWKVEIPLIMGNHKDLERVAKLFKIPFHYFPITKENKAEQEEAELELLKKNGIDFIVLGRYMQILSPKLINPYKNKVINIHHSFLPAFPGAKPYHSAYQRGVKIIGATAHYVTEDLDEGPIISQNVTQISHKDTVKNLMRKGQDLEKIVLSQAIYLHLRRRILVYNNRTIIFS
jgi:formyltetrahydrofolate deformylase